MGLQIITNHVPRPFLDWCELTESERRDFDWIEKPEESGESFFRYRGSVYCLSDFMAIARPGADMTGTPLEDWDGYATDSYFSGVAIKLRDNGESVIVARYFS